MTYYAGIELGGTKLVAVHAREREIVDRVTIPTADPGTTLAQAVEVLRSWHRAHHFASIGIGSFGPVRIDPAASDYGRILATPKPGWSGADVVTPFTRFECPVALDTDVNAAALAEAAMGAGKGVESLIYLTIGTGIGGGIISGGTTVRGMLHPELGHMTFRRAAGDRFAGVCPFHGDCIEGLVSGPALHARLGTDAASVPRDDARWNPIICDLAQLLSNLIMGISPRRIIVGGGVGLGQQAIVRKAAAMVPDLLGGYLPGIDLAAMENLVGPPELGADAGPLGAILLAEAILRQD